MERPLATISEQIQTLAARTLATQPVGHQLHLIGGFRYRLLDASCRTSVDIDYHWEGDLDKKQAEVVEVLRQRLLPEVKRQLAYDGDIRASSGPGAESPAVRTVDPAAAANLRVAGGAAMIWDGVTRLLTDRLSNWESRS